MDKTYRSRSLTVLGKFARLSVLAGGLAAISGCQTAPKRVVPQSHTIVQKAQGYTAELAEDQLTDASLALVNVEFEHPFHRKLSGSFEGKSFAFYPLDSGKANLSYQGIFGIPYGQKPGTVQVKIMPQGMKPSTIKFTVIAGHYKSEQIKVQEREVEPNKKDMKRILREVPVINAAVRTNTLKRYWKHFYLPLDGPIYVTDAFGTRRVYNGELKHYHGGIDFRAKPGTPIHASAAGRVELAKNLFFTGNTVILNHGYGLVTMYFHMSKLEVKKGQFVKARQVLGLSGATGRVTGPHLHWQADLHQVRINPMDLIQDFK